MSETMKAAVEHEFGRPLVIEEAPVPEVPDGQVAVQAAASGVCRTDLDAASGGRVAVSGIGGLGHRAVQCARTMACHVIGVDRAEDEGGPGTRARRRHDAQRRHPGRGGRGADAPPRRGRGFRRVASRCRSATWR